MELIRSLARKYVGPASPLFKIASHIYNDMEITRLEGLSMRSEIRRLETSTGAPTPLRLKKLAHPITVRPGTEDIQTILNNVIREEYAYALPEWRPKVMIDAGGFIGDTSAYFLTRYPDLKVIALEPEAANLALAQANLAPYGDRAMLVRAALSGAEGVVHFSGSSVSGSVQSSGEAVAATTVPKLIEQYSLGRIDLLKMDIEGAELDVFRGNASQWLPKVDMVIAELHGPAITDEVCAILKAQGFSAIHYRSLTFFRRPDGGKFA